MKHLIGQSRNSINVYVDLIQSAAAKHISRKPHLLALVSEAVAHVSLKEDNATIEHDMKRPIGYSFVVATTDEDKVFYAKLLRDTVYTRFVKNAKPMSTSCLTLHLKRAPHGYDLLDVLIGPATPPRPGSPDETAQSRPYWATHAVILDTQSLQSSTAVKDCPY